MEREPFYSLEELSRESKMHLDTLRRYVREGKLKARKFGKKYVVDKSEVDRFMAGEPVTPKNPTGA